MTQTSTPQLNKNFSFFIFLGLGIALVYYAFRNQDLTQIWAEISKAKLWVLFPVLAISLFGHIIRALRWQMLLQALKYKVSLYDVFNTMMFGYLVNYAVPRLGEVVRCLALNRKTDISFNASFGTVMTERLMDLVLLFVSILGTLWIYHSLLLHFFKDSIFIPLKLAWMGKYASNPMLFWIVGLGALGLVVYFLSKKSTQEKIQSQEADRMVEELWQGIMSLGKVPHQSLFILYSVLIWVCYFFTTYLWFWAFDTTAALGVSAGLTMMVIGSIGRSVPVQGGGMGAYHYLVAKGMLLFGIEATVAAAFAVINHGSQTVYQMVLGTICLLLILFTGKRIELQSMFKRKEDNVL